MDKLASAHAGKTCRFELFNKVALP
jgi:hypothetical protein